MSQLVCLTDINLDVFDDHVNVIVLESKLWFYTSGIHKVWVESSSIESLRCTTLYKIIKKSGDGTIKR